MMNCHGMPEYQSRGTRAAKLVLTCLVVFPAAWWARHKRTVGLVLFFIASLICLVAIIPAMLIEMAVDGMRRVWAGIVEALLSWRTNQRQTPEDL